MDDFKNFITENKFLFDSEEPNDDHFDKFAKKLKKQKKQKKTLFNVYTRVAAVALILIVSSVFLKTMVFTDTIQNEAIVSLGDVSKEYKEVETFYKSDVETKLVELETLDCRVDDSQIEMVFDELDDLGDNYKLLQKDLQNNIGDERIIHAMISNYQVRVEILDQVINQIKENC